MQNADAKRRMRVPMHFRLVVCFDLGVRVSVDVNVDVSVSTVFVFVFVHLVSERLAQSPDTNSKKHHTHKPFAPGRKPVCWNQISQPERQQSNDCNTGRMTHTPSRTWSPRPVRSAHCQRSDCRQVVRSGPNMDGACDQARYGSNHSFRAIPTGPRSGLAKLINQQTAARTTRRLTNAKLLLRGVS